MQTENLFTPNCIRTFSGKYIDPCNPEPELICIEDIAHALSMQPRFGGHLPVWYSVAQHSLNVSKHCLPENKFQALMHDASEAYLLDIPTPIKSRLTNYAEIENNLMKVISKKYFFEWPMYDDVKENDIKTLHSEWHFIMLEGKKAVAGWDFKTAKINFIKAFYELK